MPARSVAASLASSISLALLSVNPIARAAQPPAEPVRYMDAHSHLILPVMTADEEIALLERAGLAGVVIMHPEPDVLQAVAKRYPGFVIPFISVARTPDTPGLRLNDDTAAAFAKLLEAHAVCGFGEMPTRLDPNPEPSDAAALTNRFRAKIYDLAAKHGVPVTIHVSLETPAVIAAVERIAASHERMPVIVAHAGWMAGPGVIDRLLTAHRNLYIDLSVRLDPVNGWTATPAAHDGPNEQSILTADGLLQPAWRALIERFPDRFMFAMDVTGTTRHPHIDQLLAIAKRAFSPLPRETQEALAHANLTRLLGGCWSDHR